MLDLRQTFQYAKFMESIGWVVERKNRVNYFIKKFSFMGSFIKIQRPEKLDFDQINEIAKKYRAFQVAIEPKNADRVSRLAYHGYKQSKSPYVPSKTIHIDLAKTQEKLLKEMHYKTRYNIKKAIDNKLKVINSKNIKAFADFWQECARKQRKMFLSQKKEIIELYKAFGKNAHLILAYKPVHLGGVHPATSEVLSKTPLKNHPRDGVAPAADLGGELLAGILMVRTKDIAYYMYAASNKKGKKLFAPTLNAWEAIRLAQKLGCKIFDFEGIYDERFPLKSWRGFTRFKKSFGGKEVEYPGTFVKYRIPF